MTDMDQIKRSYPNLMREPIGVWHRRLMRLNRAALSAYRSECPFCANGVLLVRRDQKTFELLAEDRCVSCGQRVVYQDIEDLRRAERTK